MTTADYVWAAIFLAGAAYELYTGVNDTEGDMLSQRVRQWFRVQKSPGRATFLVAWVAFSMWFLGHIAFGW